MVEIVRATQAFACTIHGVPKVVRAGDLFRADDPCVKGRESLFESITAHFAGVEQATAAPGELRQLGRRRSSRARNAAPDSENEG